ncbi:hypothetical protein Tco_0050380 [Tanacetum coccineum]
MLKVSPWKGVIRFGKQGKLNPRYIELPEQLSRVHSTFHVFNLKKCFVDEPLAIPLDEIHIDDKLNLIEELVEIPDAMLMPDDMLCLCSMLNFKVVIGVNPFLTDLT